MNIDLTSPAFKANPYPLYARLRDEAPIQRLMLSKKQPMWLITRYADVVALLKDDRFSKDKRATMTPEQAKHQPWVPAIFKPMERNMLDLDDPDHGRLRGLVHKAFTPRLIAHMQERIQRLADDLLDRVQRRGRMDIIKDYALPIPTTIIAEMLGVPASDHARFHRWSNNLTSAGMTGLDMLKAMPSAIGFLRYSRSLVKARRLSPGDDLISGLVQAEEAGDRLSEDELVSMIVLLLIAGHETTVNLIGNGMQALLEHPDQLDRLRRNPALLKTAVEELARFNSPVALATERYARQDIEWHGVTIPRGELVFGALASANRDERQFAEPDRLDLGRDPNKHLAFGQGAHYCLGAPLARMEAQIAIGTLLQRVEELRPALAPQALRWRKGLVLRGLTALPVALA
jgi:cytochrome P450 PksS